MSWASLASHPSIHAMDCIISHRSPASTRPRDTGLKLLSSTGSFGSVGFNRSCAWPITFAEPPTSTCATAPNYPKMRSLLKDWCFMMFYLLYMWFIVIYCTAIWERVPLSLYRSPSVNMSTQKHVPLCSIFAAFLHGPCKPLPCNYLVYQDFACFPQVWCTFVTVPQSSGSIRFKQHKGWSSK